MAIFQPTPVLPSNAPLWAGSDNESSQLHALSHQPSHRQLDFLSSRYSIPDYSPRQYSDDEGYTITDRQTRHGLQSFTRYYPEGDVDDNIYLASFENRFDYCTQQTDDKRHKRPSGTVGDRDERKQEAAARKLAILFSYCEGYIKYRTRQPKEIKGRDDQKWPDHMEDAFLRALVRWPPVGRKKQTPRPGVKPMGRNELIADYIQQATSEVRTRKQVSSHIQVLKPFVQDEPDIMLYLSQNPAKGLPKRQALALVKRHASMYPIRSHSQIELEKTPKQQINMQNTFDLELEEFRMYMRTPATAIPPLKTLHEYTSYDAYSCHSRKPALYMQTKAQLYQVYPELSDLLPSCSRSRKILSMEASLTLHNLRDIQEQAPDNQIELAIASVFRGPGSCATSRVLCRTHIYRNTRREDEIDPTTGKPKPIIWDKVNVLPVQDKEGHAHNQYVVEKFRSTFWATTIWALARDHQTADSLVIQTPGLEKSSASHQATVDAIRNSVSTSIGCITAVQEFIATTDDRNYQSILTLHWRFRQAQDGEAGITSWHEVIVPSNLEGQVTLPSLNPREDNSASIGNLDLLDSSLGGPFDSFTFTQSMEPVTYQVPLDPYRVGISTLQSPISFSSNVDTYHYPNGASQDTSVKERSWPSTSGLISSAIIPSANALGYAHGTNFIDRQIAMNLVGDSHSPSLDTSAPSSQHSHDTTQSLLGCEASQIHDTYSSSNERIRPEMDLGAAITDHSVLGAFDQGGTWSTLESFEGSWTDSGAVGGAVSNYHHSNDEKEDLISTGFDLSKGSMVELPIPVNYREIATQQQCHDVEGHY